MLVFVRFVDFSVFMLFYSVCCCCCFVVPFLCYGFLFVLLLLLSLLVLLGRLLDLVADFGSSFAVSRRFFSTRSI